MENKDRCLPIAIDALPVAANVCQQELREVWRAEDGSASVADVKMQPGGLALLHLHGRMSEFYDIQKGEGEMTVGQEVHPVGPNTGVFVSPGTPHRLRNTGEEVLRHRVWAFPAFDPNDVEVLEEQDE